MFKYNQAYKQRCVYCDQAGKSTVQCKHVIFFSPYLSQSVEIIGIIEALYLDLEDLQTLNKVWDKTDRDA